MSLTAIRNQPKDQFGYFNVSYTGTIERIDSRNINQYRDLAAENGNVFLAQNTRLADSGIFPAQTMAGKQGSLIVACRASEAEAILDVTFGVPALERSGKVISFAAEKEKREASVLSTAFGEATEQYPIRANFRAAVGSPVADNLNHAPALEARAA